MKKKLSDSEYERFKALILEEWGYTFTDIHYVDEINHTFEYMQVPTDEEICLYTAKVQRYGLTSGTSTKYFTPYSGQAYNLYSYAKITGATQPVYVFAVKRPFWYSYNHFYNDGIPSQISSDDMPKRDESLEFDVNVTDMVYYTFFSEATFVLTVRENNNNNSSATWSSDLTPSEYTWTYNARYSYILKNGKRAYYRGTFFSPRVGHANGFASTSMAASFDSSDITFNHALAIPVLDFIGLYGTITYSSGGTGQVCAGGEIAAWSILYGEGVEGGNTVLWNNTQGNDLYTYQNNAFQTHNAGYIWNGSSFEKVWTKA